MHHDDGTPVRRRPSGVAEEDEYDCSDRSMSVSCPCIDHFDDDQQPAAGIDGSASDGPTTDGTPTDNNRHRNRNHNNNNRNHNRNNNHNNNNGSNHNNHHHTLHAPSRLPGFPRVNSAPVTPMAADCLDMTTVSHGLMLMDDHDVNEPLIRTDEGDKDGGAAVTFV